MRTPVVRLHLLLGTLLGLLGCGGGGGGADMDGGVDALPGPMPVTLTLGGSPLPAQATIEVPVDALAAMDPHLDGFEAPRFAFDVRFAAGWTCDITVERDGAPVRALEASLEATECAAVWDGTGDSGVLLDPGAVELVATLTRGTSEIIATHPVEILRLGLDEVALTGPGRVPLLYAATDGVRGSFYEVGESAVPWRNVPDSRDPAGSTSLELADGTLRTRPSIWEDLTSPPIDPSAADDIEAETLNLPTAWVAGSVVDVLPRVTTAWRGGVADPVTVEARIVAPEGVTGEPIALADGATGSFTMTVPASVGREDRELQWHVEVRSGSSEDGEWQTIPGYFATTHRLYALVGRPMFDYTSIPHRAWVDVVDRVIGWLDGASASVDPDIVASAIVEGVFLELGLSYDRERGASHYAQHGGGWTGASFDLSRFRDLSNGSTINCSDAAGTVSIYANMVGIDLRYHIIQHRFEASFDLNYLQPIGFDFAAAPFYSGRSAFRYHAVTGPPDTRIFDATLAIDGDGVPASPPHITQLVQGLSQTDYLFGLTPEPENVRVFVDEKMRIR